MRKIFLILQILILCAGALYSETTLTIDEAVEMALLNNLELESKEIEVEKREYFKNSSWDYFIPSMTASSSLFRYNETDPNQGKPDHWFVNFEFSASLSITSALFLGVRHTILDYRAGLIDLNIARSSLIRDVKKSFYNLLLLKENIRIFEQNLAAAEKRYNQAAERYEYGLVPELDKLSAQVSYENLKPVLADMRIGYEMAVLSFKQIIGMDPEEELELAGDIEIEEIELDLDGFLSRIQDRFDIQAMKQQIEILENIRKVSISQMLPVLTFMYTADPTFMNDPFEGGWFDNTEDDWVQQRGMFSITLSISLDSLLPRSKTWVDISQREDEIRQANIALAQMIQMAQLEIESLVLELEKSIESIETLELNVRLAERAYELAETAYNAGNRDLLDVQNAELELQKAKLKVLEEKTVFISGLLDLQYAINNSDNSYVPIEE